MPQTSERPTGTVTFLFTDIEGSTRLLQRLGDDYPRLLSDHHSTIREAIRTNRGVEVKTEGDAFFVVFERADDGVRAAVAAQRGLAEHEWPGDAGVRVRMGLHTGEVRFIDNDYVGLDVHRAARIAAAAHGGQVLLSETTYDLARPALPDGVTIRMLGEHRLKDLDRPERLYQLVIEGLPSDFPPIRSLSTRIDVVPAELTSFIGREAELVRIRELLAGTRLLTLTGPGGTGKTRLALQAARQIGPEFIDGVAFVPLAPISDPGLVAPTIRQTLGYVEEFGRTALETLLEHARDLRILLVLDNFEQVLPGAEIVARLLEGTSALKLIVTSRAALRVSGEQEFPIPPLRAPGSAERDDPVAVAASEAVALFVQRARAVRPDFAVTSANARAIVEICERLDGLPLAIELAASRVRLLTPEALVSRLSHRLDLLQSTAADRTDRQRTLRGAIDWSHELLNPTERAIFRRLGLFVGGWDLDDAEAIVPVAGGLDGDIFDGLAGLVDHNLVRSEDIAGATRFAMLETIREYALERLAAAGEVAELGRAHAERYAGLVERLAPRFTSDLAVLDRIERDHDNVRAALRWAIENGEAELAMLTGGRLWRFWHLHNHLREGRALLEQILAMPGARAPTLARATALNGLASLLYWQGEHAEATEMYTEALEISRATGDRALAAEVLYGLGFLSAIPGDYRTARERYGESLAEYSALGDRLGMANARFGAALTDYLDSDYEAARPGLEASLQAFRELGDAFGVRNTSQVLGRALQFIGDYDAAFDVHRRALEQIVESGDMSMVAMALQDAAAIIAARGDPKTAVRLLGASYAIQVELGALAPPTLTKRPDPLEKARAALSEAEIEGLLAEGHSMSRDEALRIALAGAALDPDKDRVVRG